jgi:hypothetical protein
MGSRRSHFLCILVAGSVAVAMGCSSTAETAKLRQSIRATPAKQLAAYPDTLTLPLERRVGDIPSVFLDRLRSLDQNDAYSAYALPDDQREMVVRYLHQLPPANRRVLEARLIGLYFVSGLTGTGFSDYVLDTQGHLYVVMAFNPACLTTELSEWMTKRERSAFAGTNSFVSVDCGTGYTGFLYAILHESTHALDYIERLTPFVEPALKALDLPPTAIDQQFTTGVWKSYSTPLPQHDYPLRAAMRFYGVPSANGLKLTDAGQLYDWLEHSPFVSLYGAQSWAEDLAESVTWFHFVSVMGGTYALKLTDPGGATRSMRPELKVKERPGWASVFQAVYRD